MFNFYNLHASEWAICQIADNCNVNKKVAKLLGIVHVGCNNHKLNSEVQYMMENNKELLRAVNEIHKTKLEFKMKLRNRSALRNLTSLNPILYNKTSWNGKYLVLRRFLELTERMIQVADASDIDDFLKRSNTFRGTVLKYVEQMKEICDMTSELQKKETTFIRLPNCIGCSA